MKKLISLLTQNWMDCAQAAWHGYLAEGRGVLALDVPVTVKEMLADEIDEHLFYAYPVYVGEGGAYFREKGAWPDERVTEMVRGYDPHRQVVLLAVDPDGDFLCLLINGPNPKSEDYPEAVEELLGTAA